MVSFIETSGSAVFTEQNRVVSARATGEHDEFGRTLAKAEGKLRQMSAKLVSSALLLPMLNQMQDDPFRSDLFHGGMTEDLFQSMLNTRLSDAIAEKSDFALTDRINRPMLRWLQEQPNETVRRVATMRIDTLG